MSHAEQDWAPAALTVPGVQSAQVDPALAPTAALYVPEGQDAQLVRLLL